MPDLVSEPWTVQWLGRYREGVSTHRLDLSTKIPAGESEWVGALQGGKIALCTGFMSLDAPAAKFEF